MGDIVDKCAWSEELLKALGNSNPSQNTKGFVTAWEVQESGPGPIIAANHNPLNCTLQIANSTSFNVGGVQNYATYQDGLSATVQTLHNGLYPALSHALSTNDEHSLGFGSPMAKDVMSDLTVWVWGPNGLKANGINQGYINEIAAITKEKRIPCGGDLGTVTTVTTPIDAVIGAISTVTSSVASSVSDLTNINKLFDNFQNPAFIKRLVVGAVGIIGILAGLGLLIATFTGKSNGVHKLVKTATKGILL